MLFMYCQLSQFVDHTCRLKLVPYKIWEDLEWEAQWGRQFEG